MPSPVKVRPLTSEEQLALEVGRQSSEGFTVRRSQILLASAAGYTPREIAQLVGCSRQNICLVIHAFESRGVACLSPRPSGPKPGEDALFDATKQEQLKALAHTNPRNHGQCRSTWTLKSLAQVCYDQGIVDEPVSYETIRQTLLQMGVSWKRAKQWITSPDPDYARKKHQRDRLIHLAAQQDDWSVGFQDEVWWSRLAHPQMHAWCEDKPFRLHHKQREKTDPDPKAIACYGLWCPMMAIMVIRFVQSRPVSDLTCQYLTWVCDTLYSFGKRVLVLIWDNATWHRSKAVRQWVRNHNRQVKQTAGVRLILCLLPVKSPWLNAIEAKWVHAKRAIVEPTRLLTADELKQRVCDYFECELLPPLVKKTA